MRTAVAALSICLLALASTSAFLWRENAVLRSQLDDRRLVTRDQLSSVASACENLIAVNQKCLAYVTRVKGLIDGREESGSGNDQVRSAAFDPGQGGSRR
jgi:hypothetical protein